MITGIHHFGLTVSDMSRSLPFYTELFGMDVASDREVDRDYVEVITGIAGAHLRLVHLQGHGVRLELIQYINPVGADRSGPLPNAGAAHVCFLTDDLDVELERLARAGVEMQSSAPVTTTSGPNKGGRGVYLRDPDGNAVEVVQLAPSQSDAA